MYVDKCKRNLLWFHCTCAAFDRRIQQYTFWIFIIRFLPWMKAAVLCIAAARPSLPHSSWGEDLHHPLRWHHHPSPPPTDVLWEFPNLNLPLPVLVGATLVSLRPSAVWWACRFTGQRRRRKYVRAVMRGPVPSPPLQQQVRKRH